jgi:GNAT superfamily N-acetyltransferase
VTQLPCGYRLAEGIGSVSFEDVHAMLVDAYWCRGIAPERVYQAARGSSLLLSVFFGPKQVAYMRVVSDRATFGWICDVIVHEDYRGKGLGRAMVRHALAHPEHQKFRRWVLATQDAQGVYADCGFIPLDHPDRWMVYRPADSPEAPCCGGDVV